MRGRANYGAVKTRGMGSKFEAAVYDILKLRELAGEIKDIKCQQPVVLQPGPRTVKITWKVDFSFCLVSDGSLEYVEAKGFESDVYRMKLKMFRAQRPAPLTIYKGTYRRPFIAERIEK